MDNSPTASCAFYFDATLLLHQVDYVGADAPVELRRIGVAEFANVAGVFDDGALHAQANAEKRDAVFAHVFDCADFPLDAPRAEPRRHEQPGKGFHIPLGAVLVRLFRVDPHQFHAHVVRRPRMDERLGNAFVRVVQLHIFAA